MQDVPVQIFYGVVEVFDGMEHHTAHNAGECQREAERDNEQIDH